MVNEWCEHELNPYVFGEKRGPRLKDASTHFFKSQKTMGHKVIKGWNLTRGILMF